MDAKETPRVAESVPTEAESAAAAAESEVVQKESAAEPMTEEKAVEEVPPSPTEAPELEPLAKQQPVEAEDKKGEPKKESSKESDEEDDEDDEYEYRDLEGKMYTAKGEEVNTLNGFKFLSVFLHVISPIK